MTRNIIIALAGLFLALCTPKYNKSSGNVRIPCGTQPDPGQTLTAELGIDEELEGRKTGVYSLENGGHSLVTRAWLCDHARKTMDIQYYIFSRDNSGKIASDYLVRAAARGVKIRLIIDDITVQAKTHEIHLLDSHENIEIKVYNPGVKLGKPARRLKKIFTEFGKLHRRMHIKTLIVDGAIGITGGRNIADEYFDYDKKYNFRDRDVLLAGKEVAALTEAFELYWNDRLCVNFRDLVYENKEKFSDPARFDELHRYACDTMNFSPRMREKISRFPQEFRKLYASGKLVWTDDVSFVADVPGKNEQRKGRKGGRCTDSLVALIRGAKESIDIQSPYLILTRKGKALFSDAVKRGVKVRVLTNSLAATDNFEAFSGYKRDRKGTLNTGIEVYEFRPDAKVRYSLMTSEVQAAMSYSAVYGLHSKSMIVDGKIAVIGSFNLDPRSADYNTECIVIVRSPKVASNLAEYMEEEFLPGNAWRTTYDFNPDKEASFKKRLKVALRRFVPKRIL